MPTNLYVYNLCYMKNIIRSILIMSLLVSCNHETMDEKIKRQAQEFTESSCPKPMDKYTMLDSLVYTPDVRMMCYHYSVSRLMDTTSVYTSEMLDIFHGNLLDNIRSNTGLIDLKRHGITFRYRYTSSTDTTEYMNFIFTPEDYR